MATYGSFPGVRVTTQSGGISSIEIGEEEKIVIFGESDYKFDNNELVVAPGDDTLNISASTPEQINALAEADKKFGESELSTGMKEALANGANIDFLYGVAVPRTAVVGEVHTTQSGSLDNLSLVESTGTPAAPSDGTDGELNDLGIHVVDTTDSDPDVRLRYDGEPTTPDDPDTIHINPLTGQYAADAAPDGDYEFSYTYNDYSSAFSTDQVRNVVNEDETGIYVALSDSDSVSASLQAEVSTLRNDYQLVNAISVAEPNDNRVLEVANTSIENGGANAIYDAANYDTANQSVSAEYYYKFAPGRKNNSVETIAGGVGGLFAGNPISDPIYNESLTGYSSLEQSFSKTDADNMRNNNIIPIRSGASVRVQGNVSTSYNEADTVAADFWTRRITDRVILIGKQVGDRIIGKINDEDTREQAGDIIRAEMRGLVQDRLIRPNTDEETNWSVEVYEDSTNRNEVNIDISFSPFGIVKRVDETITVDTSV